MTSEKFNEDQKADYSHNVLNKLQKNRIRIRIRYLKN